MSNTNNVEIIELAKQGHELLVQSRKRLEGMSADVFKDLLERIPQTINNDDGPLKVVFAGQYSAGKSSVISALTGREDIPIGAGITTQHTQTYHWQGVDIVDTPGIHTTLRPDHDEISYRTLSEADLVVFVTTNELFDDHLAEHFQKLAIGRDKGHEMLLLINKMQRHNQGNTEAAHQIVTEALRDVLAPLSPESLRISFVDAQSAIESSRCADDPEEAQYLWQDSGLDAFANNLNAFIRDKGLAARYTTSLYSLEQVLQEAIARIPSGDPEMDGVEELLVQSHTALLEERQQVTGVIRQKVSQSTDHVREEGRKLALMMHGEANPNEINQAFDEAKNTVDKVPDHLTDALEQILASRHDNLQSRLDGIMQSELAKELLPRLSSRVEKYLSNSQMSQATVVAINKSATVSEKFGVYLVKNAFSPTSTSLDAMFKLKSYSGTPMHEAVKKVGKYFGKSFKPWEAVKWTKNIAHAGRVLAVAGVVVTFVMAWREDVKEAQREKDLAEARAATRFGFNEAADAIDTYFDEVSQTYVAEVLDTQIKQVNKQLTELRDIQARKDEQYHALVALLEQTQALIRRIHESQTHFSMTTA